MDVRRMRNEALGKRVVKALESRNMEAYYASTKEEACLLYTSPSPRDRG